ncbi:MAG: hypothetical protein ACLU9S_08430 [Oscillospiraceae bacterium]
MADWRDFGIDATLFRLIWAYPARCVATGLGLVAYFSNHQSSAPEEMAHEGPTEEGDFHCQSF